MLNCLCCQTEEAKAVARYMDAVEEKWTRTVTGTLLEDSNRDAARIHRVKKLATFPLLVIDVAG